ncbi:MAG TPA: DUF2156 domain-containing protein [Thermoanaerobaculia bacterium]|nr:DUF2156 domain-containing protein [Thermoanaerobaculia bacterium]
MRAHILELLKRHGWNATSFQILEPEFRYWLDGDDACVAYVEAGRAWVVAGSPIAPEERIGEVAARFVEHARRSRRRVAFFAVEQRFLRAIGLPAVAVGQQPVWNGATSWSERHRGHRSLREQLRRARAKGVVVERADPRDAATRAGIQQLIERWLSTRKMPAMAFLVALHPFVFPDQRRYFVARQRDAIVGLLVAVPVYRRDGWFFEDILRDPRAPNGTTEALVDFAMRELGDGFATLGLVPLAGDANWMRWMRRASSHFYSFDGLRAFKAKFRPDAWDPIYLAYPEGRTAVGALYDVLVAFAQGRLVPFAFRAMLRSPQPVAAALAALLVPWIATLAMTNERWFPSRRIRWMWVSFDTVLAAVLFTLAKEWRPQLARAAAVATAADAVLTTVQAARWNVPRAKRWTDGVIIAASLLAPVFATVLLWRGRNVCTVSQPRG